MATITVIPYIPRIITVHLGTPEEDAPNVSVPFAEYIKNVVSSEIYPTWEPDALLANTLAIISYALNRVYTEFYRSRGYDFDITASTAIDQRFINGRNIFENISELVDTVFNTYIRRVGFVEPLAAKFCNGVTVTCDGLSQWGSQYLAQDGADADRILREYYGSDIDIVTDAPVQELRLSYPGAPVRRGDLGVSVAVIQTSLNRISQNYPAIPKVLTDAIFGPATEEAVKAFQSIFSLTPDGVVGRATWYRLVLLYDSVLRLSELQSQGQIFSGFPWETPQALSPGDSGAKVTHLQYMLSVIAQFVPEVQSPGISGVYNEQTEISVRSLEAYLGLPETGVVTEEVWLAIYAQYAGIRDTVLDDEELFPFSQPVSLSDRAEEIQMALRAVSVQEPALSAPEMTGRPDAMTRSAIAAFQELSGLPGTGRADPRTREQLAGRLEALRFQHSGRFLQFPGQPLQIGQRDEEVLF